MSSQTLRWWHTVRHLRAKQVYGRAWFRLHRPHVDERPAPPCRSSHTTMALLPGRASSLLRPWVFRFLNEEHDLATMSGWDDSGVARLWRYNLHYFDDLLADDSASRVEWHRAWMTRWMAENPPGRGSGWEPYPTSLRIVNWIAWSLAGNRLPDGAAQSLAVQARWLDGRLEHHLLGNHLWANAKALVFAGVWFDGPEAARWCQRGLALLERERAEQVLGDGGHFERSPMYHAIVLADLLELVALDLAVPGVLPAPTVVAWRRTVPRMLHWLAAMTHPDGEIALFNDAAFGIARQHAALARAAAALRIDAGAEIAPESAIDLADSGYARLQRGSAVLIADVGLVGPDHIPGHAHADTLSFELSLRGRRVLVDTGTSRYDVCAERLRQRGTAAHNTVQIDGADSSEVWSSFRVGRRARPFRRTLSTDAKTLVLGCAHDGYRRLAGRPVHHREWRLHTQGLSVIDTINGRCREAIAHYHFHPDVVVSETSPSGGDVLLPDGTTVRWQCRGGIASVRSDSHHCEFNRSDASQCLELLLQGDRAEMHFAWD